MLHKLLRLRSLLLFVYPLALVILSACVHGDKSVSDERAAYMADYDSPHNKWGFINKEGEPVIKAVYDDVGPFSEGMAAVNKDGLWGFIDKQGTIVIKPQFKSVWTFHEHRARILQFDQPEQFIDPSGKIMSSKGWSAADDFSEGLARVKEGNSFGYIDSTGTVIIQAIYTRGWNFKSGVCMVDYNGKLGVINLKGAFILNPEFDFLKIAGHQNIILARNGKKSFAYDIRGTELTRLMEGKMSDSDGHLISVKEDNGMYLFDLSSPVQEGKIFYKEIIYLEDALWAGKTNKGFILLGHNGEPLTTNAYNQINKFSNGFAAFSTGEYWGYMDHSGVEKTSGVFGLAWDYKEGLARTVFRDGISFIDEHQKLAFYPPKGSLDLRDYSEGLASIQME